MGLSNFQMKRYYGISDSATYPQFHCRLKEVKKQMTSAHPRPVSLDKIILLLEYNDDSFLRLCYDPSSSMIGKVDRTLSS